MNKTLQIQRAADELALLGALPPGIKIEQRKGYGWFFVDRGVTLYGFKYSTGALKWLETLRTTSRRVPTIGECWYRGQS